MAPGDLITRESQIEWSGLLLGDIADTNYEVLSLEGWNDLPSLDSGNADRAGEHGAEPGRPLAQQRFVTATFNIVRFTETSTRDLVAAVRAATAVSSDGVELPLVVRDYDGSTLMAWAQVAHRAIPMPQGYARRIEGAAIQWQCSDPRRYALVEQSVTIAAPSGGTGGLPYPLEYPLDWGSPGTPGLANATNNGDADTFPRLTINGPVTKPAVTNFLTGAMLEVDVDVDEGQQILIDTRTETATLAGASVLAQLTNESVPLRSWVFAPGDDNPLVFTGGAFSDDGATAVVSWRSAWW